MQKACEYLIVGQGLAGTSLAMHLLDLGASVLIMDDRRTESSSRVAAGLFNPITGRKMVKTWKADELFDYLPDYYRRMENLTSQRFLHDRPLFRPFASVEEQNEWMGKSATDEYTSYVDKVYVRKTMTGVQDAYGGILLKRSGYLDVPLYLDAMESFFTAQGIYLRETFDRSVLEQGENEVGYREIQARKLIFCDGSFAVSNTFFNWLPFRPVKGELLEVAMDVSLPAIVNRGVFVMEIEKGVFRVGSTYDNKVLDWKPTEAGREYILGKLNQLLSLEPEVQKHYAGVRPASSDRRPIIGSHPEHRTIGLFNGLGTKGVSLSPWFGKHYAMHLNLGNPLLDDVNISRYFSLY